MQEFTNLKEQNQDSDAIDFRQEIENYLYYWKWFTLGIVLSLFLAYLYLRYTTPQYSATGTIMIKDNQKSGISDELKAVADLGIVGTGSANNTDNEIEIIKSRKIVGNVVDTLNLNISYFVEGSVIKKEVYKNNPLKIKFIKSEGFDFTKKDTLFSIEILDENKFILKNQDNEKVRESSFCKTIKDPHLGNFIVLLSKENFNKPTNVFIRIKNRNKTIDSYRSAVKITPIDKNSSVLKLSFKSNSLEKAEDFLDELVYQYNLDAIKDKNEVSKKTKDFIDERLEKVYFELANIQDSVKNFKTKNKITGLSNEAELVLEEASKNNEKLVLLKSELSILEGVYKRLQAYSSETLPPNLGLKDENISQLIVTYNKLVLEKNSLKLSAGPNNPILKRLTKEAELQKINLLRGIENLILTLKSKIADLRNSENILKNRVNSIPSIERGFIDIARQQEIISALYSYLLKKKEETAISLAVTVPNAKIIDTAYGSTTPVAPRRKIIYLIALFCGLFIPFVIIYLRNLLDTKVHTRKDIDQLTTIPFLGDIPNSESNEKIVISKTSRTSVAEAFRLIRTNLDFVVPKSENDLAKTIFVTSTTSGEGKSFVSINLSASLCLSGKKVLLIGMDLRAPKVIEYLGLTERKGVTNYITDNNISIEELKFSIPEIKGLDIISSGVIPPNPAELLLNKKVTKLFKTLSEQYDYVVVDTAPVGLVTDTLLISKFADSVLYVSRANYLDKRMLNIAEKIYKEKKLPNMSIILNDTDTKKGYGYTYGYGYVDKKNKPWYKKVF